MLSDCTYDPRLRYASDVRPGDLYLFVTQLDDPDQPWVEEPPQFEVIPLSKNEKKRSRGGKRQKENREREG